jgi:hypothetical protein
VKNGVGEGNCQAGFAVTFECGAGGYTPTGTQTFYHSERDNESRAMTVRVSVMSNWILHFVQNDRQFFGNAL